MPSVAWGITGSGAFLADSVREIARLRGLGVSTSVYVSRAGEELLRMYGLLGELERAARGPYPNELILESEEGASSPKAARVYRGVFDFVVVSPATLNTCAKIALGVADSLVTNLASHALKARVPLIVVPSDLREVESEIPLAIDRELCAGCESCAAAAACPTGALREDPERKVSVDLSKCVGCGACASACPKGAVRLGLKISVEPHEWHRRAVAELLLVGGVAVFDTPSEAASFVLRRLGARAGRPA